MQNARIKQIPADWTRVKVDDADELRYWTQYLRCSPAQLRAAVAKVGIMAASVAQYLSLVTE